MENNELKNELVKICQSHEMIYDITQEFDHVSQQINENYIVEEIDIIKKFTEKFSKLIGLEKNCYDFLKFDFDLIVKKNILGILAFKFFLRIFIMTIVVLSFFLSVSYVYHNINKFGEIIYFLNLFLAIFMLNITLIYFFLFLIRYKNDEYNKLLNKFFINENKSNIIKCLNYYFNEFHDDTIVKYIKIIQESYNKDDIIYYLKNCFFNIYKNRLESDLKAFNIDYKTVKYTFFKLGKNVYLNFEIMPSNPKQYFFVESKDMVTKLGKLKNNLKIAKSKQKSLFKNLRYVPFKYAQDSNIMSEMLKLYNIYYPKNWNELFNLYNKNFKC